MGVLGKAAQILQSGVNIPCDSGRKVLHILETTFLCSWNLTKNIDWLEFTVSGSSNFAEAQVSEDGLTFTCRSMLVYCLLHEAVHSSNLASVHNASLCLRWVLL